MVKSLRLLSKIVVAILVFFLFSCEKECLEISKLEKYMKTVKEWTVLDSVGNQTIIDNNGIKQTLIVTSRDSISYDNTAEDDCGNIYGSFFYSIQYNTSVSPINFMIDINGGAALEEEFYLKILITNTNNTVNWHKSATYNFYTKKSVDNNAVITYIDKIEVSNKVYSGVLKFVFNNTFSDSDVKEVYYAKKYGLIKFKKVNGNTFEIK
jgi:hypothetical protein